MTLVRLLHLKTWVSINRHYYKLYLGIIQWAVSPNWHCLHPLIHGLLAVISEPMTYFFEKMHTMYLWKVIGIEVIGQRDCEYWVIKNKYLNLTVALGMEVFKLTDYFLD